MFNTIEQSHNLNSELYFYSELATTSYEDFREKLNLSGAFGDKSFGLDHDEYRNLQNEIKNKIDVAEILKMSASTLTKTADVNILRSYNECVSSLFLIGEFSDVDDILRSKTISFRIKWNGVPNNGAPIIVKDVFIEGGTIRRNYTNEPIPIQSERAVVVSRNENEQLHIVVQTDVGLVEGFLPPLIPSHKEIELPPIASLFESQCAATLKKIKNKDLKISYGTNPLAKVSYPIKITSLHAFENDEGSFGGWMYSPSPGGWYFTVDTASYENDRLEIRMHDIGSDKDALYFLKGICMKNGEIHGTESGGTYGSLGTWKIFYQ